MRPSSVLNSGRPSESPRACSTESGTTPPLSAAAIACMTWSRSSEAVRWIVRPLGVYQRAVVSLSAVVWSMRNSDCTSPLPKVGRPTTSARSWSCRAPAMISAALADPTSTSTTIGIPGHAWGLLSA